AGDPFEGVSRLLENSPRRPIPGKWEGKYSHEPERAERPVANQSERLGCYATTPILGTQPVPDFSTSTVDVRHQLEPHAADGTPVNDYCESLRWVERPNATDPRLGIA